MIKKSTKIGMALVIVGLIVPQVIDAIETAYYLDIKRDIGVLPWLIMAIAGAGILVRDASCYFRSKK
jgi:hypothetical protein